jgi:hypothetical protein
MKRNVALVLSSGGARGYAHTIFTKQRKLLMKENSQL